MISKHNKLLINSVKYSYSVDDHFKINDLSIQIPEKKITTLIGKNGSGKTTLLLLMMGYLKPLQGEILIVEKGKYISVENAGGKIAFLSQNETISMKFTVDEFLLLGRIPFIKPFSQPARMDYDIVEQVKNELDLKIFENKRLGEVSGGELQRIRIGRVLVQESDILILDEPITFLDIGAKANIFDLLVKLKRQGKTIVFSTHDPLEAFQIADESILLTRNKHILMGATEDVLNNKNLSDCLDTPVQYGSIADQKYLIMAKKNGK